MVTGENSSGFTHFLQSYLHHEYEQTVINLSLGIVIGAIVVSIISSLIFAHQPKAEMEKD